MENYAMKELILWLKRPAELCDRKGEFWDNPKVLVLYLVRFPWWYRRNYTDLVFWQA
jgi:hypothetical protein